MTKQVNPEMENIQSGGYTLPEKGQNDLFPTEVVDLPSKGLVYPPENPLSKGVVEIKYMSAKEEDILSSQNLIQKGIAIDKLLQELIVSNIRYNDLLLGDKNSIMVASRILAYGQNYDVDITCPKCQDKAKITVDLQEVGDKEIDVNHLNSENRYDYELPISKIKLTYKFLTQEDEIKINEELRRIKELDKKIGKKDAPDRELSTRLRYMILAINGDTDQKNIRTFIDTKLSSRDALEFRKHLKAVTPDVDLSFEYDCENCGTISTVKIPITVSFFWPDVGV